MMLKICSDCPKTFGKIREGDFFAYNGFVYMKTVVMHGYNAISTQDGTFNHFLDDHDMFCVGVYLMA